MACSNPPAPKVQMDKRAGGGLGGWGARGRCTHGAHNGGMKGVRGGYAADVGCRRRASISKRLLGPGSDRMPRSSLPASGGCHNTCGTPRHPSARGAPGVLPLVVAVSLRGGLQCGGVGGAPWIAAGSRIVAWLGHGSQIGQLDLFCVAHQRVPDKCSVKRTGVVWQVKYNRRAAS